MAGTASASAIQEPDLPEDWDEIQTGLEHAEFDDEDCFPSFDRLPNENDLDEDFYAQLQDGNYIPRRHWCFLAQIISVERFDPLRIVAKDGKGKEVVIGFYTDDEGNIDSTLLQPGNTVAILYAHQHQFLDLTSGIRQETFSTFKIISTALDDLYKLSERIGNYFPAFDGKRICHGCDKAGVNWMKCARCTRFWYCSKDCQIKGWKEKGHKKDCKILRDRDVLNLLRIEYDMWTGYHRFPINEGNL